MILFADRVGNFARAMVIGTPSTPVEEAVRLLESPPSEFYAKHKIILYNEVPWVAASACYSFGAWAKRYRWALRWFRHDSESFELWFSSPQYGLAQVLVDSSIGYNVPLIARVAQVQSQEMLAPLKAMLLSMGNEVPEVK